MERNIMKIIKLLMPLGMISAFFYFLHVFLGQMLWKEYNPITTDISSLTADGAPNADLLRVFTLIYGVCFLVFTLGMILRTWKENHIVTRIGYILFFVMAVTTVVGYNLFPLTGNKNEMNFQNMMHIIVTVIVVFTTILSIFIIAFGYLKKDKLKILGRICLLTAFLITIFGATNPIGMGLQLNILGLSERLVIYTLQLFVFFLSFLYSFDIKLIIKRADT